MWWRLWWVSGSPPDTRVNLEAAEGDVGSDPGMVSPEAAQQAAERTVWLVLRDYGRSHQRGRRLEG